MLEYDLFSFAVAIPHTRSCCYQAKAAKPGITAAEAWNACSLNLAETARSHCYYFMLIHFADIVSRYILMLLSLILLFVFDFPTSLVVLYRALLHVQSLVHRL